MMRSSWQWSLVAATFAYVVMNRLGHTYGSTAQERSTPLPGDSVVVKPHCVCTHATTIAATPEQIWPWLVQMGWHRGGWYTARWVDRVLFPANWPSADHIVAEWQELQPGAYVPDGAPETHCGFTVLALHPAESLVLHSTSHLPRSWRASGIAALDWTWAFSLRPLGDDMGTRFLFRWRARMRPWWLRVLCEAVVVPADLLMSRDMLRGVRSRAEPKT